MVHGITLSQKRKMAKTAWKGVIAFGPLVVPIVLTKAVANQSTDLHEYHITDKGSAGRRKYCKDCDKTIVDADIVKGIEVTKGTIVYFSEEELKSLPLLTARQIDVEFVDVASLGNTTIAYYITSDKFGEKPYNLLRHGLASKQKAAVGKFATKGSKEHLCAIQVVNGDMVLSFMPFADEIRPAPSTTGTSISEKEAGAIEKIMEMYTVPFNHERYKNEYLEALMVMAQAKLDGKEVEIPQGHKTEQSLDDALASLLEGAS